MHQYLFKQMQEMPKENRGTRWPIVDGLVFFKKGTARKKDHTVAPGGSAPGAGRGGISAAGGIAAREGTVTQNAGTVATEKDPKEPSASPESLFLRARGNSRVGYQPWFHFSLNSRAAFNEEEKLGRLLPFLPESRDEVVWLPFYCSALPAPLNFLEILETNYGYSWPCTQLNKCNNPAGKLFQVDYQRCSLTPCYHGGRVFPYKTCQDDIRRGKLRDVYFKDKATGLCKDVEGVSAWDVAIGAAPTSAQVVPFSLGKSPQPKNSSRVNIPTTATTAPTRDVSIATHSRKRRRRRDDASRKRSVVASRKGNETRPSAGVQHSKVATSIKEEKAPPVGGGSTLRVALQEVTGVSRESVSLVPRR